MKRYVSATCPCCGYVVFSGPPGSYEICPICYWEDDEVQLRFPTLEGGANKPSLIKAQKNFVAHGACEERFKRHVRSPNESDRRDGEWRPIKEDVESFERPFESGEAFVSYPDDFTTLYYWRANFWRRQRNAG